MSLMPAPGDVAAPSTSATATKTTRNITGASEDPAELQRDRVGVDVDAGVEGGAVAVGPADQEGRGDGVQDLRPDQMNPSSLGVDGSITLVYTKFSWGRNFSPRYLRLKPAWKAVTVSAPSSSKVFENANPTVGSNRIGPPRTLRVADGPARHDQTSSDTLVLKLEKPPSRVSHPFTGSVFRKIRSVPRRVSTKTESTLVEVPRAEAFVWVYAPENAPCTSTMSWSLNNPPITAPPVSALKEPKEKSPSVRL